MKCQSKNQTPTMDNIHNAFVEFDFKTRQFPVVQVGPMNIVFSVENSLKYESYSFIKLAKKVLSSSEFALKHYSLVVSIKVIYANNLTSVYRGYDASDYRFYTNLNLHDAVKCVLDVVCVGSLLLDTPPTTSTTTTTTSLSKLSDLDIICDDGRRFKSFKVLLAQRSPVFAAMFTNASFKQSNEVAIRDVTSENVEKMTNMVLSSQLPTIDVNDVDFVLLCDRYEFSGVVEKWISLASKSINCTSAISIMRVAQVLNNDGLLDQVMKFIKSSPMVSNIDDLTKDELLKIIKVCC